MKDVIFRGEKLIDREDEIASIKGWFEKLPKEILWIYGPKSSGKTTIIEYIVENELFEDFWSLKSSKYWVKYINFRRRLVSSYDTFLNSFIFPDDETIDENLKIKLNLGVFKIDYTILGKIKEKELDLFDVLITELKRVKKQPIIIIDEIQTLEDIYINGERELLKEFLNFCVSLTKELHLSHVVILSSNTIFINKIYNDAKLKVTSRFYKIDHLSFDTVQSWLHDDHKFQKPEIELIWEYLGGSIAHIQRMIRDRDEFPSLKEYLDQQAFLTYTEMVDFLARENSKEEEKIFRDIARLIVEKGGFEITDNFELKSEYIKVIDKWAEKEIFFFDPMSLRVNGNSRIYEKGMEILLKGR